MLLQQVTLLTTTRAGQISIDIGACVVLNVEIDKFDQEEPTSTEVGSFKYCLIIALFCLTKEDKNDKLKLKELHK